MTVFLSDISAVTAIGVACLVVLLTFIIVDWYYFRFRGDKTCALPVPPGSMGFPLVGETPLLISDTLFYKRRRERYGQIYKTHILGSPTVRLIGADVIGPLIKQEGKLLDSHYPTTVRTLLGENAVTMSKGAGHKLRRRLMTGALSGNALQRYLVLMDRIIKQNLQEWIDNERLLVYERCRLIALQIALECLIGCPIGSKQSAPLAEALKTFFGGFFVPPIPYLGPYQKALKAKKIIEAYLADTIKSIMADELTDGSNVLTQIWKSSQEKQEPLSMREMIDMAVEMVFAGNETTTSTMTSLVLMLGKHPKILSKLRRELEDNCLQGNLADFQNMPYLGKVIKETLRLCPPAGGVFRKAKETLEVQGYQIPKGWMIILSIMDTHETSHYHGDASTFDPDRWTDEGPEVFSYIPFFTGMRKCAGREFAKLVLRMFAVNLVRMCDFELENPDVRIQRLPVLHPKDKLPAKFRART